MKIANYSILCWRVNENTIFGQLIGLDKQVVTDDVRTLKASFTEYIEKQMKQEGSNFFESDFKKPKVKAFPIEVRPNYHQNGRIYPVKENIEVQVYAVYAKSERGHFECFLPELRRSFYFYNKEDLEKLIEHFSKDIFHGLTPSEIYKLLLIKAPWVEEVSVKIPKAKKKKVSAYNDLQHLPTLASIAERLPYSRKQGVKGRPNTAWERSVQIQSLINLIISEKSNVLIVGKSGIGKSAIINDAIKRIVNQQKYYQPSQRNSFWRTTPARMTAKARYLGEWQMIAEDMVYELETVNGVLWVENFVTLATTGGEGPEDSIAAFLTAFIRQGTLKMISEISEDQLEAMRRILPGFVEHFRILKIEEMNTKTTLKIFDYFNEYTSKNLKVNFSKQALEASFILLDRFIRYESFPGKAIQFLSACANQASLEKRNNVHIDDIIKNFSEKSGIPAFLLKDEILINDKELHDFFKERIKGQDHVIDKVCAIIKVFKAGLNDPNKPIATLIFAGPTGVGKTATVKAISEYFFGMGQKQSPLMRLDMSEFQHPGQIYRLIGSQGKLIQHVREKPFTVLLLDEIEKANSLIFDALLTVLDEGILLDSAGRMTDFRNTIIIMTSNLGASQRGSLGFRDYQGTDYESSIRTFFRPEFFNRIDALLAFNPLDKDTIIAITLRELEVLEQRDGIQSRGLKLIFTDELVYYISDKGFDKKYGARPLQREIERLIVAPLAHLLIGEDNISNQSITIDYKDGKVVFDRG